MADRTRQEIFNLVVAHSRAQPHKALKNGICAYLTLSGDKCWMGALMPPEKYKPELEGIMMCISEQQPILLEVIFGHPDQDQDMIELMKDLQYTHDCCDPSEWPAQLGRIAYKFNLTVPA